VLLVLSAVKLLGSHKISLHFLLRNFATLYVGACTFLTTGLTGLHYLFILILIFKVGDVGFMCFAT
jgi:hypothetical protein